jgi:enoyl-CoA hydratase
MTQYGTILAERDGAVGIVTLNRPQALNALNRQVLAEVEAALAAFDRDDAVGAMLLTGSERAFAAGADVKEMAGLTFAEVFAEDFFAGVDRIAHMRKPLVAAVAGHCLGGGCELAMACDFILAAEGARFGQPEINLGIIPGGGGTQRLVGLVGKGKAMELCLTGRIIDAAEAERIGLVARVFPAADLAAEARAVAAAIAAKSRVASAAMKEAVNAALETPLAEGLRLERRMFHALFATADQKEGMAAFVEKRAPAFTHR